MNDNKKIGLVATIIAAVFMVVGAICFALILGNGDPSDYKIVDFESADALDAAKSTTESVISFSLNMTYIALIIAVVLVLVFGIYHFANNVKGNMAVLYGLIAIVVVFAISYVLADDKLVGASPKLLASTSSDVIKNVDMGIYSFLILFFIAIGAIIWAEVSNVIK